MTRKAQILAKPHKCRHGHSATICDRFERKTKESALPCRKKLLRRRPPPRRSRQSSSARARPACSRCSSSACSASRRTSSIRSAHAGGQCTELYPDKPIYDIPALPVCGAQELVDRLLQQIKPFDASSISARRSSSSQPLEDGRFHVTTSAGTRFIAGAVVIAAGVGSFQPRRLAVEGVEAFEGRQVHYRVKSAADFHGQRARDLRRRRFGARLDDRPCGKAASIADAGASSRASFARRPPSVARMRELVAAGRMRFVRGQCRGHAQRRAARSTASTSTHRRQATADCRRRAPARVLRAASEARPDRRVGPRARQEGAQGGHGEVPDQRAGHLRDRRHQHLSGQEEADPERLPRGGAGRVRDPASPESREEGSSCSTRRRARSCRSGWASREPQPHGARR